MNESKKTNMSQTKPNIQIDWPKWITHGPMRMKIRKNWQKLDTNVDEQNEPEYLKKSET